jgi:hypothetical protein
MKVCEEIFHDILLSPYHGRQDYMSRKKCTAQNSDAFHMFTQLITIKTVGDGDENATECHTGLTSHSRLYSRELQTLTNIVYLTLYKYY